MAIIAVKVAVDVAKTYAAAAAITGITKANPGVVSHSTHGYVNGDILVLAVQGMVELDGQVVRIANKTTDTYELEGVDTTAYGTFTSGTDSKISAWDRYGEAADINVTQGKPDKVNVTTSVESTKQYEFGLGDSVEMNIVGNLNPFGVAVANLQSASRSGAARVLLITYRNGMKLYVNCAVGGGEGFGGKMGDKLTNEFTFSVKRLLQWFAS